MRRASAWVCGLLFVSTSAFAQNIISAQSGTVHYVEGSAFLADQPVQMKTGVFPTVKENAEFRTETGRAEILLNPGVFLRLSENSAIRMLDKRLASTRVEVLRGSVLVEAGGLSQDKDNEVYLLYGDKTIHLRKSGVYRVDSNPPQLRVYEGEVDVRADSDSVVVKKGRLLPLTGMMVAEKFDAKEGDPFYRWAARRAEYISVANISAAKQISDGDLLWNGGGWFFNRYLGLFTFVPGSGYWYSPFGYQFYSPRTVYRVFQRPVSFSRGGWGGGGWNSPVPISTSSSGYGGSRGYAGRGSISAAPSPSTTSVSAPSAPVRGGGGRAGGSSR